MIGSLKVYNVLTGKKEIFEPVAPPYVGMYVCGPTVYNKVHLGNVRTFVNFDIINRYLRFVDYKVRYVRNITDVGHLLDSGEDKIAKKAKLENLEPMAVVQRYVNDFHRVMHQFNALPPDIEPTATGHLLEQIDIITQLLQKKLAYESNGSVYFNIEAFSKKHKYGVLSKRNVDDMIEMSRTLDGSQDKRSPMDFALWKKAEAQHIMRWKSAWSDGFPGWHLECSAMSTKYLGQNFDIHGGGMDLKFPHHDCEIAQNLGVSGKVGAKYWLHSNMLTVNGQKMSKSLGNSFLPEELFNGTHPLLDRGYDPMSVRFFILQSHYSSTLDFSNEALRAAQKGYFKLANGLQSVKNMTWEVTENNNTLPEFNAKINAICDSCYHAMNDDFNTALAIGHLFKLLKRINALANGQLEISQFDKITFERMKTVFIRFFEDVLGLKPVTTTNFNPLLDLVIESYKEAKSNKNFDKVDAIRDKLKKESILLKDSAKGVSWEWEE